MTTAPSHERKDVEAVVLELEKLLGDSLGPVPRLCPALGGRSSEDGGTVNLCATPAEHGTIHEGRAPTPKAGRHEDERFDMVAGQVVPDLSGGIEADGLGFSYENDLPFRQASLSGHHFGDTSAHRIGHLRVTRSLNGHECPW